MLFIEEVLLMSKSGYSDMELLEYINEHFDEIECELNGEEYKEPKHNRNLCIDCNVVKTIDYERSTLVCTKCGLCEYYPVYVTSYNHTMQPLRRKCKYKRSDNFKVTLNQSFYGGNRVVPDDIMETIRGEIHSIYFIYFKLSGGSFPHITTKEYNTILNTFIVISSIYDKYKPNDRKSFLNYSFVLKKLLIMLGKVEYAKYN